MTDGFSQTRADPVLLRGVSDDVYHRSDGCLSSTLARLILTPGGPARVRDYIDSPTKTTPALEFGKLFHAMCAGENAKLAVIDGSWATKKAKEEIALHLANGSTPVKPQQFEQLTRMVEAVQSHRTAAELLSNVTPEVSAFWNENGVACKARFDYLPNNTAGDRLVIADLKSTARGADAESFGRTAANYDYPMQADFYLRAARATGVHEHPEFVFIVAEKEAPYLVNVLRIPDYEMFLARQRVDKSLKIWYECLRSNLWPGYEEKIEDATLPSWWGADIDIEVQ